MTAAAIHGPIRFTLLAILSWQAAGHAIQNTPVKNPPTYEELSTSLVVNQLAILQLMHDSSNASCAAVEVRKGSDGGMETAERLEEAVGAHVDRVLATLEARQRQHMQQMLGALNTTAINTMTRVEELREEMKEELAKVVPADATTEPPTPTSQPTQQSTEEAASVPEYMGAILHNDSVPSLCSGNKYLTGTLGSLEVVRSGTYSSGVLCSWNLTFPRGSLVSLNWDYINMEESSTCGYDWVEVKDVTRSQLVYGRRLCGNLDSSILKHLNVRLQGTHNLLVSFSSDSSTEGRGFRMTYHPH